MRASNRKKYHRLFIIAAVFFVGGAAVLFSRVFPFGLDETFRGAELAALPVSAYNFENGFITPASCGVKVCSSFFIGGCVGYTSVDYGHPEWGGACSPPSGGGGNGGTPQPSCTSNGSCSAATPACGTTTSGTDNCGNSCSRTGPVCPPITSILANGNGGTIILSAPANFVISWTSSGASSCTASGSWSGAKPTSGSQSFSNVGIGVYSYGLFCTGPGGSTSATVGVNVSSIHEVAP